MPRLVKFSEMPDALSRPLAPGRIPFCALADTFSLTPCFSWGLSDVLTRQPFQRLWAEGKPLKAVARLRPPPLTLLKQGVNERAVNTSVRQGCLLVQKLRCATAASSLGVHTRNHLTKLIQRLQLQQQPPAAFCRLKIP